MTQYTCPCCGSPTEVPQLFTRMRQKVFFHVWDNPGCTQEQLALAIYPNEKPGYAQSRVSVHLALIGRYLSRGGEFSLQIFDQHRPRRYKITYQRTPTQESHNGTNQRDRIIP